MIAPAEQKPEESWEIVLERAGSGGDAGGIPPINTKARTATWMKALLPVGILILYGIYKTAGWATNRTAGIPAAEREADSLTGVKADLPAARMDRAQRDLVAKLEGLVAQDRWEEVRRELQGEIPAEVRSHPVIRALELASRVRTGERNIDVERDLRAVAAQLPTGRSSAPLREAVALALAHVIVERSNDVEWLLRNAGELQRLMKDLPPRPAVLEMRVRIATRYERLADGRIEKSSGMRNRDEAGLREGRSLYQSGLRWLVTEAGWSSLTPFNDSFRPHIERILAKIEEANRTIHPVSLPFSNRDAGTWTGRKGDPVHDAPR